MFAINITSVNKIKFLAQKKLDFSINQLLITLTHNNHYGKLDQQIDSKE